MRAGWVKPIAGAIARLGRDVAQKVLPLAFASDAERMGRFQREAQVLAALNDPIQPPTD
jgi:serine/threonine protein kinase